MVDLQRGNKYRERIGMDFLRKKVRLGEVLVGGNLITQEQLDKALEMQKGSGKRLGDVLVQNGFVDEESLAIALSNQLHCQMVDLSNMVIDDAVKGIINSTLLKKYCIFPYAYADDDPNTLMLAMADPLDMGAMDDVSIITNLQVQPVVATRRGIMLAIDKYYGDSEMASAADQYAKERKGKDGDDKEEASYNEDVENSPIVQLVKAMIEQAVRQRTSDIHIEPMEKSVRVRYRIDGALYERASYSSKMLSAIVARIKIIGGMDISEKRKPQDGRITQIVDRQEYDIRVSVLPTVYGEKVVMRITSKSGLTRDKAQLGFSADELRKFDHILQNPHGIILVTGPTGSGKSTTLYTALSELNTEDVNIITVEDPVEANIDGINQVQVNVKAELTFASALRSILRQDPDIIMIGEIRDKETATIAVQASITGHLVVSTLHTNSSASTITRLADMGIENYLIADSVVGVIAQRLVRRLCPYCKEMVEPNADERLALGVAPDAPVKIYKPTGCAQCDNNGYKGRIGVYEIMEVTEPLKRVISRDGTAEQIKERALEDGMNTLRMAATRYVLDGITSIDEMIKVSFES